MKNDYKNDPIKRCRVSGREKSHMYKKQNTERFNQKTMYIASNAFRFILFLTMIFAALGLSLLLISSTVAAQRVNLPDGDRIYLIELITQTHQDVSIDRAQELVYELENFYTGVRDNLWTDCGPPSEIDEVFHLHIINTRLYAAFSDATFGRLLHHEPFWSQHSTPHDLLEQCGDLANKLKDHGILIKYEHLWASPTYEAHAESPHGMPMILCGI